MEQEDTLTPIQAGNLKQLQTELNRNKEIIDKAQQVILTLEQKLENAELQIQSFKDVAFEVDTLALSLNQATVENIAASEEQVKQINSLIDEDSESALYKYLINDIVFKNLFESATEENKNNIVSNIQSFMFYATELNYSSVLYNSSKVTTSSTDFGSLARFDKAGDKFILVNNSVNQKQLNKDNESLIQSISQEINLTEIASYLEKLSMIPNISIARAVFNSQDGLEGDISNIEGVTPPKERSLTPEEAIQKLQDQLETSAPLTTADPIDTTAPADASVTEEDPGYAQTINDFIFEEIALLTLRNKEFSKMGLLYVNPIMRKILGVDFKDIIANASEKKKALMEKDLQEMYEHEISQFNQIDIPKEMLPLTLAQETTLDLISFNDIEVKSADLEKELEALTYVTEWSSKEPSPIDRPEQDYSAIDESGNIIINNVLAESAGDSEFTEEDNPDRFTNIFTSPTFGGMLGNSMEDSADRINPTPQKSTILPGTASNLQPRSTESILNAQEEALIRSGLRR